MTWLNYHHLLYFWTVATEGTIVRASEVLRLAPSTISVQIKELEEALGEQLFERKGRQLVLTEAGHVAQAYAEEIFTLGREMVDTLQTGMAQRPTRVAVGVSDVLPKLIVYRLLEPIFDYEDPIQLVCVEGEIDQLLGKLSIHELDVVLTDAPLAPNIPIQAFNHPLGQSEVGVFGAPELVEKYGHNWPESFSGAPFILPGSKTSVRRALGGWFERKELHVHAVAEVDDRALMQVLGEKGRGFFAAPAVLADEVYELHGLEQVGILDGVKERFYAVTLDRRIRHPVVDHLTQHARRELEKEADALEQAGSEASDDGE